MALTWPSKDPDEVLDYVVDWSQRLSVGDTILSSIFSIVSGSGTINSQSNTTNSSTVWLSGGTLGDELKLLCRVVTSQGRTMDQTVILPIQTK